MPLDVAPLPPSPIGREILDDARTLVEALRALVDRYPEEPAIVFVCAGGKEQQVTFAQLWQRARELQACFVRAGLRPRGVALLALPTCPDLTAAYFGAMLAGGIPALVATPFHRFAGRQVYAAMISAILRVAHAQVLYAVDDAADVCRRDPSVPIGGTSILTPAMTRAEAAGGPPAEPAPADVAMIQYSSGSTGDAKGVLLTHRAMLNNMRATRDGLRVYAADVSVNWAPLYHDMGLVDTWLRPMLSGSRTVLIPTAEFLRDPALWLRSIHRHRATITWAPNFAYALCAKRIADAEIAGLDLSSLRIAANASEPCLADSMTSFARRFAAYGYAAEAMTPAWGCAETVCIATAQPAAEAPRIEMVDRQALVADGVALPVADGGAPSVSIGRCLPENEVEIRDDDGRPLADRQVGRIWLRSNSLFAGYQGDPELTARVLVDGWFFTGDRGYVADGYVFFLSREKDLIVIGGEKYAPQDVETAIGRVTGAREGCAIAFGVMNEGRGTEDVAAVVETKEERTEVLAELREAIRREVTRATGLALRWVVLVPPGGIAKTTSGKLARSATKARYLDQLPSAG